MQTGIIITIFNDYASAAAIGEHEVRCRYDFIAYMKTLYHNWSGKTYRMHYNFTTADIWTGCFPKNVIPELHESRKPGRPGE
jgi:hypothetical protein